MPTLQPFLERRAAISGYSALIGEAIGKCSVLSSSLFFREQSLCRVSAEIA